MASKKKRYYSATDIAQILDVCRATANRIMRELDSTGHVLKFSFGSNKHMTRMVEVDTFEKWLAQKSRPE